MLSGIGKKVIRRRVSWLLLRHGYFCTSHLSITRRHRISIVQDEFAIECQGNWGLFEERYPGLRFHYTKLVKAIRVAQIDRGDTKARRLY
jgi:hypothetical protein